MSLLIKLLMHKQPCSENLQKLAQNRDFQNQ